MGKGAIAGKVGRGVRTAGDEGGGREPEVEPEVEPEAEVDAEHGAGGGGSAGGSAGGGARCRGFRGAPGGVEGEARVVGDAPRGLA